jgi:hypothetical protein
VLWSSKKDAGIVGAVHPVAHQQPQQMDDATKIVLQKERAMALWRRICLPSNEEAERKTPNATTAETKKQLLSAADLEESILLDLE